MTLWRRVRAAVLVLAGERPARLAVDDDQERRHADACAIAGTEGIMTDVLRFPDGPDGVKAAAFTRECVYRYVLRAIEKYRLDGDPETRKPPGNAIQS